MTTAPHPLVESAIDSVNNADSTELASLFTPDGSVVHVGHSEDGIRAIAAWFARIPPVKIRPVRRGQHGAVQAIDAQVAGISPDGAEVHRFRFVLAEQQIRSMAVNVLR